MGEKVADFANPAVGDGRNTLDSRHFLDWHGSCSVESRNFRQWSLNMEAQENQIALPLRPHTIFGVCEAIGEDFGFNPVLLRVPFAATVLWSPIVAIGAYFALAAVVLASRLLFPQRAGEAVEAKTEMVPANEQRELARAA
jgi:phage shock protein PspC (stress-responsive transcriptional regulator)